MNLRFRWGRKAPTPAAAPSGGSGAPRPQASGATFSGLTDPLLAEFMRSGWGLETESGAVVTLETALRNPTFFRAATLVSGAVGMLPLHLIRTADKAKATEHPLYRVLHRRPNVWQTAFDFKAQMQLRAFCEGDAVALKVMGVGLRQGQVQALVPLSHVTPEQGPDWSIRYRHAPPGGAVRYYAADEVFHLRGLSLNGLTGLSLYKQAREAIGLALRAEQAGARLFKQGVLAGQALKHPAKLSPEAYDRLKASLESYSGAENAGKSMIFEEGLDWANAGMNARDAQMLELRKFEVEEVARVTGIPRPLLMVDETSWGSGIDVLGQFFVRYALGPWFTAWEQAIERSLLGEADQERFAAKFNAGALLRGSMKDQAEFFAKALGSGGHPAWLTQDEVRDLSDLPPAQGPDTGRLNPGANGGASDA